MPSARRLFLLLAALAGLLAVTWWAYHPGLSGGFLFDDFGNLPALGATGPVDNWATFWRYITSGHADPTGRPVALLSFLIDARNWPADPRPFLRTSMLLHLCNGVLLFCLLRRLGHALVARADHPGMAAPESMATRIELAALLGAAFWLLHPLFVSTTLYIVQREAMLAATFTLLGLLGWLRGRRLMLDGRTGPGLAWLCLGLGVCALLGFLSKADGILLPALALVIEWTILRAPARGHGTAVHPGTARRHYRRAMWVLAGLPALFVAFYLLHAGIGGWEHGVASRRSWTLGQRLLTEPRVLLDYLQLLWLPRPFTPGLFNDQIHVSTSLLAPWTTLPCILAVAGLIAGACLIRRRWPAVALAVLFYFVGQSLESSTIALELFYEHRNYQPALLLFWPLALWLCGVPLGLRVRSTPPRETNGKHATASPLFMTTCKGMVAIALLAGIASMTHARTSIWGNQKEQALIWAKLNPTSPRAQAYAAQTEMTAGHPQQAIARLKPMLASHSPQLQIATNLFGAECQAGAVTPAVLQASKRALHTTRNPGSLLAHWFQRLIRPLPDHPACPQDNFKTIKTLLHAAASNPHLQDTGGRLQDIDYLRGLIALAQGKGEKALRIFNRGLDESIRPGIALKQAAELGSHGYPMLGLAHLAYFEKVRQKAQSPALGMPLIHAWVLHREGYWTHELRYLRTTLRQDATTKLLGTSP